MEGNWRIGGGGFGHEILSQMSDIQNIIKEDVHECSVWSVSVRGWLALMLVATVCALSGGDVVIREPLYSMAIMVLGFYFGQKTSNAKL